MTEATLTPLDAWVLPLQRPGAAAGSGVLESFRAGSLESFRRLGWPAKSSEAWKYSDVRPVATARWGLPRAGPAKASEVEGALSRLPGGGGLYRLVFIDGAFVRPLSSVDGLPAGVTVATLARLAAEDPAWIASRLGALAPSGQDGMAALNGALFSDGYVLRVGKGVKLDRPVEAVFLASSEASGAAMHLRNLVVVEEGGEASLVDVFTGPASDAYLVNSATEVFVGEGAGFFHARLQEEGHQAYHFSRTAFEIGRGGCAESHVITTGARQSRQDLAFSLGGEDAECTLNGLFVLNGRQKADHHTLVDHKSPSTRSSELYKGALDGAAEGSFTGRVVVRKGAQSVEAHQQNPNLLLSDIARVNTRPQLEIYADDVKCSHGATSGRLDETALFYLRSRGIEATRARQLLTRAFAGEIIQRIPISMVREHLLPLVDDRLCPGHLLEETP